MRERFDEWLKAEQFNDKRIVHLTLAEGEVVVERHVTDADGHVLFDRAKRKAVTEITRYPVRTLPPAEVFQRGER